VRIPAIVTGDSGHYRPEYPPKKQNIEEKMSTRGKIIRDTSAGNGIISINGKQYPFSLEEHWKSDTTPKTEMVVDVELNSDDTISTVQAVTQNDLVKEQLGRVSEAAQQMAKEMLAKSSATGLPMAKQVTAAVGIPTLVALSAVFIGWVFMNTFSIHVYGDHHEGISFYGIMKLINNSDQLNAQVLGGGASGGAGFYGFLVYLSVLLPLVPHIIKNRNAWLAYTAPLALMLTTLFTVYWKIKSGFSDSAEGMRALGGGRIADIASEMFSAMMKAVSMGMGFYIALAAAGYLAARGIFKFLATR
jgi:hypothetical protein